MKTRWLFGMAAVAALCLGLRTGDAQAAALSFVGSDSDLDGFPGGAPPYVVVPWRSEADPKAYDIDGNNVYGSAGYALFGTQFSYPTFACCGSSQPFASPTYPNKISLPSFVTSSQNLVNNKTGGWSYSLIDDPELVNGYRDYNWGLTQVPPRPGPDQSPYVKIGSLEGTDILGLNPRTSAVGAGRWLFTVGAGVPSKFRVGVMSDGLDGTQWAATEVLLHQVVGTSTITGTATSGTLVRNRFVDIHSFDIIGAQPGDQFAIFAKASNDGFGAIAGVTFDVAVPEPASISMFAIALVACGGLVRSRVRERNEW